MREWVVRCSRCGHDQVLDWDVNVVRDYKDGKPAYVCAKCREPLRAEDITEGQWVSQRQGDIDVHGYHVSHMMMPISRPLEDLLVDEATMSQRNFYNLRLGKPWTPVGGSMTVALFRDRAFDSQHRRESGPEHPRSRYYFGADQGNNIHVVVARSNPGDDVLYVVYAEHIHHKPGQNPYDRLEAIIKAFDVDFCIIDGLPYRVSAHDSAKRFHGKVACASIGSHSYQYKWFGFTGDDAYRVVVDRTDLFDGLRDDVLDGKVQMYGRWEQRDNDIDEVIHHCANMKRDTREKKTSSGGTISMGVWRPTGSDHFAFALAFARLARIIDPSPGKFRVAAVGNKEEQRESKVWGWRFRYD